MIFMQPRNRYVGHSRNFSFDEAMEDAAQQARGTMSDAVVEFSVVNIRGRIGGVGAIRDLWVEIRVAHADGPEEDTDPRYTTMAFGEEGGDEPAGDEPPTHVGAERTTLALGEEGGDLPDAGG